MNDNDFRFKLNIDSVDNDKKPDNIQETYVMILKMFNKYCRAVRTLFFKSFQITKS